ncbi:MAG TPA: KilA-N domain-containing protein [Bacteroidetes bacterium]|nr:KilA-N domain-containing protein [Bacteroidota bacterium]
MAARHKTISVNGTDIRLFQTNEKEYISLTDIAKRFNDNPSFLIVNWLRNKDTLEFLSVWEKLYNADFNLIEFDKIKEEAGHNRFIISTGKWVETTKAIGLQTKAGRYGGTYAHKDIALGFCYWLSPPFQLYVIKEFQRLKEAEFDFKNIDWNVKRIMSKANHRILTEAVREYLVPIVDWNTKKEAIYQATEADLLNLALFGLTAREWQSANPERKGNIRDHASPEQLLVLSNMQSLNSKLLKWGCDREQRVQILNDTAREELNILLANPSLKNLPSKKKKLK